jgi:hypothetical protein
MDGRINISLSFDTTGTALKTMHPSDVLIYFSLVAAVTFLFSR